MKNWYVKCYESRNIKEHEINYSTHDLELKSIVHALKMWRHYFIDKKCNLKTYYNGLKHLFENTTLNSRKTRWMGFLSEYNFDIKHIEGKNNKVDDALNKRVK